MMERADWEGCYPSQWRGLLVPDAMKHPAKFSSRLITRIYQHASDCGWLHPGDTVLDPFAGVATGALAALRMGLHWRGVELEEAHQKLGADNIALWNARYALRLPRWGTAVIYPGDSRYLADVLPLPGAQAVISSPPFLQSSGGTNQTNSTGPLADPRLKERHAAGNHAAGYGGSDGQLHRMPAGDYRAAISSPPFARSLARETVPAEARRELARARGERDAANITPVDLDHAGHRVESYGDTPGNLGNQEGQTFWEAARQIIEQTFAALAPGGHAIWVTKGYVRGGELVDFPCQWRAVCEAVGFRTVHEHRALLVREGPSILTLEGEEIEQRTEYKTFFRRLLERKGTPRIDWETVWCMERP